MNSAVVLDASALLVLIQNEAEAEMVSAAITQGKAMISTVNLSEVIGKLAETGMPKTAIEAFQAELPIEVTDFNESMALEAGMLRLTTRQLGLSLGDRACLATARVLGNLPVLTADRAWADLNIDLKIILVGP